jgi:hypothetical protein
MQRLFRNFSLFTLLFSLAAADAAAQPCGFFWEAATNGAAYEMPCDFVPYTVTPHGGTALVERVRSHGTNTWTNTFSVPATRESWDAICGGTNWFLLKGDTIRVTGAEGIVLEVQGHR